MTHVIFYGIPPFGEDCIDKFKNHVTRAMTAIPELNLVENDLLVTIPLSQGSNPKGETILIEVSGFQYRAINRAEGNELICNTIGAIVHDKLSKCKNVHFVFHSSLSSDIQVYIC